jgi:Cytochrome oxidase c assembly
MSRSTPDTRTRFTSTSPYASSKPTPSTSSPSFGSYHPPTPRPTQASSTPPGPPDETPQEKVARLRAASRLAKAKASMSPLDRAIDRGRRVADKSHRIVAYGLIGFAGYTSRPFPTSLRVFTADIRTPQRHRVPNIALRSIRPYPPQPPPKARLD